MQKKSPMKEKSSHEVMDGSDIMELVENDKVFSNFVDHKFQELDIDCDGKLSLKELQPAVQDIGAALGLPAQGSSPQSDHIYTEVLNEFTHGKHEKIGKTKFKEVLSDFLLGMATGLKRDPVVILRIDGEDLHEFVNSPTFEPEMLSIFSEIGLADGSFKDHIIKAFEKLTVDQGMPPATDPWAIIPSLTDKSVMRLSNYTVNQGTRIEPVDSDSKCLSAQWNATMGVDWAATMYECQEGVSTVAHDTNKQAWNFVPVNGSDNTYYILPENHLMDMATRALSARGLETYGGYMSTTMDLWNKTDSEQMWLVAPISSTS